MLHIITDAILNFFATLYQGFIALFSPVVTVVNSIGDGIIAFKNFAVPILEYTLWFFNVPVLILASGIVGVVLLYLYGEYIIKLILKYFTRLL